MMIDRIDLMLAIMGHPLPRCPLCDHPIELGKCWNVDCILAGCLTPDTSRR